jgi:hypothetical protein
MYLSARMIHQSLKKKRFTPHREDLTATGDFCWTVFDNRSCLCKAVPTSVDLLLKEPIIGSPSASDLSSDYLSEHHEDETSDIDVEDIENVTCKSLTKVFDAVSSVEL